MPLPQIDIGVTGNQLVKFKIVGIEQFHHDLSIKIAYIEDADFTFQSADIINDIPCLCLPDGKFIFGDIESFHHLNKGFYGKRVVLRGDAKFLFQVSQLSVLSQEGFILLVHLACIGKKLNAVIGKRYASSAPVKDRDANLFF